MMGTIPAWWSRSRVVLWALALVLVAASLWAVLTRAPVEAQMGVVQKIVYIHVPSAIATLIAFGLTFAASIAYLATRGWIWDAVAASSCEVGMVFATIVLVSGPLWARSAWNTWWTWEPRLTTFLIMWILYGGYHVIRASLAGNTKRTISAVLGIAFMVMVPITWMSVTLWRGSLHPKSVTMTGDMRQTLLLSMAAWLVFFAAAFQERLRLDALRHRAESAARPEIAR
jgi:heme exporter protein C